MTDPQLLCSVEPGLVVHVQQLLTDAGIASTTRDGASGPVDVLVAPDDDEHARAVIGLVLPHLLTESSGPLSRRLIRTETDDPGLPGGLIDGTRTFGYADPLADQPEDDSDDFVPPPPPPVPRPRDRVSRGAWAAVLGGPVLLVLVPLLSLPGILTTVGLGLFIGGFATLIFRMEERRRDDGSDDGAVV
ncbi:MAG: hypothetical protein U0R64_04865 [Candidatus Nanopelagicales bacterium]